MSSIVAKVDEAVQSSAIGRYFELEKRKTKFSVELQGAVGTFMTMAYILAVNPRILSDSGGPCEPDPVELGGIFGDDYNQCIEEIKREYITSTAIASCIGCLLMGILANLPIGLAPGMGINAYFAYTVVGFRGTGDTSFESACTAILLEGLIFVFMSVTGVRFYLIKLVPEPVRIATSAAIGAFLAHLGLQTAEGIGVVVSDIATAVTLGACPESDRTPIVALTEACALNSTYCVLSDAYTCDVDGGVMTSPTAWIGIFGLVMMIVLMAYKWRSSFIVGICFVTFISWFRDTSITYFTNDAVGDERFEYFKQVVSVETIDKLLFPFTNDLSNVGVALVTFLYVDFLDTSGSLMGIVSAMDLADEDGNFPGATKAFLVDGIATMVGSLFGLSPVTAFIESAAGIEMGARTGLTAVFVGFFFLVSIFFAPIIASIPPWATGGALIIIGALMASSLAKVKWHDVTHATTAFITVMVMPLTYSIAYGLIAGIGCWISLQTVFTVLEFVGIPKPVFPDPSLSDDNIMTKIDAPLEDDGTAGDGVKKGDPASVSASTGEVLEPQSAMEESTAAMEQ